ncbi:MAG: hypothetical protein U0324_23760 [Polyangiales bacterium]
MIALVLLSLLALVAAAGVVHRVELPGRAERALGTLIVANALVLVPVYALGLTNHLYRPTLGAASFAVFALTFVLSSWGRAPLAHWRDTWRDLGDMAALPADGLRLAWRARSFAFVGLAATLAIIFWSVIATWVGQSDSWDGMGYHEPMIGYALQNHGFRPAPVPRVVFYEAINGLPRHCEMTALWLVAFVDRRLIELPNTLASPAFLLGVYLLAKRFGASPARAVGWACATFLMPGAVLLLRSTYIDMQVGAFDLAALWFCARPGFRVRDGWLAAVAGALMIGAKTMNIAWTPPLMVVAVVLIFLRARGRVGQAVGVTLGGLAIVMSLGLVIYLRNYVVYHSPMWPWGFESPRLGIHFPGIQLASEAAEEQLQPLETVWNNMVGVFRPGYDYCDTRVFGYGIATPFLLIPLACLAAALGALNLLRALAWGHYGFTRPRAGSVAFGLFSLYFVGCAVYSPAIWQARYNLHLLAAVVIGAAWVTEVHGWRRFAEGVMAATVFANLVYLFWSDPGLTPGPKKTWEMLAMPTLQRATVRHLEWAAEEQVAWARETELRGALTVFTAPMTFIGSNWNDQYSNRVEYWRDMSAEQFLAELDRRHARWVTTRQADYLADALRASGRWRELGKMSFLDSAFIRVEAPAVQAPAAPAAPTAPPAAPAPGDAAPAVRLPSVLHEAPTGLLN